MASMHLSKKKTRAFSSYSTVDFAAPSAFLSSVDHIDFSMLAIELIAFFLYLFFKLFANENLLLLQFYIKRGNGMDWNG